MISRQISCLCSALSTPSLTRVLSLNLISDRPGQSFPRKRVLFSHLLKLLPVERVIIAAMATQPLLDVENRPQIDRSWASGFVLETKNGRWSKSLVHISPVSLMIGAKPGIGVVVDDLPTLPHGSKKSANEALNTASSEIYRIQLFATLEVEPSVTRIYHFLTNLELDTREIEEC
uniref:Uncharacterized protein n=1 Tax=Timema cristinae TaxID=61476 RepID=A0A7R9CN81_TIMCR|nr:unnamed protein product [Timema cristinae]